MNPNPSNLGESGFCDWQLLFACPCLKAKVSSFLSRLCWARGWCKDLDWRDWRDWGWVGCWSVWHWPPSGWVLLGRGPGQKVEHGWLRRSPLWAAESPRALPSPPLHTKANCPYTKAHSCVWCTPAHVNKGGKHTSLQTRVYQARENGWTRAGLVNSWVIRRTVRTKEGSNKTTMKKSVHVHTHAHTAPVNLISPEGICLADKTFTLFQS